MSSLSQQKRVVEQLRVEGEMQRLPMSQTIAELIQFIDQHKDNDPLITGIDKKQNPFQEKSSCAIL